MLEDGKTLLYGVMAMHGPITYSAFDIEAEKLVSGFRTEMWNDDTYASFSSRCTNEHSDLIKYGAPISKKGGRYYVTKVLSNPGDFSGAEMLHRKGNLFVWEAETIHLECADGDIVREDMVVRNLYVFNTKTGIVYRAETSLDILKGWCVFEDGKEAVLLEESFGGKRVLRRVNLATGRARVIGLLDPKEAKKCSIKKL